MAVGFRLPLGRGGGTAKFSRKSRRFSKLYIVWFVEVLLKVPHVLALLTLDGAGEFCLVRIDCNGRDGFGFALELGGEVDEEGTGLRAGGALGALSDNKSARLGFDRGINLELELPDPIEDSTVATMDEAVLCL